MSICDGDYGRLLVHCFAGCEPVEVLDSLRRRGLLDDRPASRNEPKPRRPAPEPLHEPDERALALWREAVPIEGTPAERYLIARGIRYAPPSLRYLAAAEYMRGRVYLPAMMAAVQAPDRRLVACQLTFLDPRGDRKAQVATPRRTYGALGAGAVRLDHVDEVLGLSEGVETALSAMALYGVPTWACLGASRMSRVAIPKNLRHLIVFADADEPGRAAAARVREAHPDIRVSVRFPDAPHGDFNDVLRAANSAEVAA
ncbi:toprim domain-containing protein [Methylocystis sp. ATCC 49242]|uniref:DUF7146 domain-containing protein n=1 Tax=Methylocystis sp. ATCC 49242 TaxID=622637 RepID=UPI0003153D58|nr:toprim domain-containing protein [Methylocystis sp. ATCC 49242]